MALLVDTGQVFIPVDLDGEGTVRRNHKLSPCFTRKPFSKSAAMFPLDIVVESGDWQQVIATVHGLAQRPL